MQRLLLSVLGLGAAAGLLWWILYKPAVRAQPASTLVAVASAPRALAESVHNPQDIAGRETNPVSTAEQHAAKRPRITNAVRDRAKADRMRAALARFWHESELSTEHDPKAGFPAASATFRRLTVEDWTQGDYIKSVLHDQYIPLARDCYEEYLLRMPRGAGKVNVNFTITGTPELGAVIENVTLGKDSTVKDETFATCLAESMYALALEAPPEEAQGTTVGYGVEFSPESPEEHARKEQAASARP